MSEAGETTWVEQLSKANEFADGEIGEGPLPSAFFEAYKKALKEPAKISEHQLDSLIEKATPEGKLYAACLSYYVKTEKRDANPQAALIKLQSAKEHVYYRSGCKGTNTTVGEVATALVKDRRFLNFDLPSLQVLNSSADVSAAIIHLARARRLEDSLVGEGDKSVLYAYFLEAHRTADKKQFEWLIHNGSSAGKLYGARLLYAVDSAQGKAALETLANDKAKVSYQSGCEVFDDSVAHIASELLHKGKYLDLKLAIK